MRPASAMSSYSAGLCMALATNWTFGPSAKTRVSCTHEFPYQRGVTPIGTRPRSGRWSNTLWADIGRIEPRDVMLLSVASARDAHHQDPSACMKGMLFAPASLSAKEFTLPRQPSKKGGLPSVMTDWRIPWKERRVTLLAEFLIAAKISHRASARPSCQTDVTQTAWLC
jgi:hypothetical protein